MDEIIQWSNDNNGFLTAILALLSLFISCIAVWVSVATARLPYKKKVKLTCEKTFKVNAGKVMMANWPINYNQHQKPLELLGFRVSAINVGQAPVYVSVIGFLMVRDMIFNHATILECQKNLQRSESVSMFFDKELIKNKFHGKNIDPKTKIYVSMTDSEGKQYKTFCARVKDFIDIIGGNEYK